MILASIQQKLVKVLLTNYAVWPLAHLVNFRFVPTSQRILYINACQVAFLPAICADTTGLDSKLMNRHIRYGLLGHSLGHFWLRWLCRLADLVKT